MWVFENDILLYLQKKLNLKKIVVQIPSTLKKVVHCM